MNRKNIAKVLRNKHDSFVASITNESVQALVKEQSIITGGSIVSLLQGEEVNDFDYYFRTKEAAIAVAGYFVVLFNKQHPDNPNKPQVVVEGDRIKITTESKGIAMDNEEVVFDENEAVVQSESGKKKKGTYSPIFLSQNAITLSDRVQLVIRFYGEPEEIHKNYDFIHCTNYWCSWDNKVVLNPDAIESILCKELRYQGSLYPICSIIRTRKFVSKGWVINAGQFLKMCFQVSELNLNDLTVLEDQLTGVDASYFFQVIDYCKKKQAEDSEFKITAPYLVSVIDKIFG